MGKIDGGYSAFSSGPELTQAVPVAQRTPTVPMEYGIPKMTGSATNPKVGLDSFETTDGRHQEIPAMGDDDMSMSEDAHPIKPFHDVLRNRGFKPSHSERKGDVRVNHYSKENEGGGKEEVELHHNQGRGPEFGSTNSVTKSGDPEATAPRVNNSPEKMDRNIHAQSYRKPEGTPSKMKPAEVREYASKIKE